jgi:DNA-binding CsgD family transcriptional regulator
VRGDLARSDATIVAAGPACPHRGPDHDVLAAEGRCAPGYGWSVRAGLLDREAELRALARQVAAVRAGAGRVIVVDGPAGIGKTSLLAAVAGDAGKDGVAVLRARGGALEQDAPWGVARQLFEPLRARQIWSELAVGAAELATRALDPAMAEPARAGDAMHAAARGLVWLAVNLAARGPALLVVDDVHWADAPSLRWLAQLARDLDGLALGVLCAVRSGEPPTESGLLAELLAAAPEPPVRPRPLGPQAAEALVREEMPGASASFARACHAVTAGNPFLLQVLLGQLAADGTAPGDEAAHRVRGFGPEQVARGVDRQLGRLPEGVGALAHAVAVLGRGAPLRHAADLAGLGISRAARAADTLRAAGLLDPGQDLTLTHPLIETALYTAMAPGERGLWHARVARLLQRERADPEAIALHLLRAAPAADPATVQVLRAAAARASTRGAPQSAATFLRRALAEPPASARDDAELCLDLGLALAAYLDTEAPRVLHEAAERASSPGQRSAIALRGARALGLAGHFTGAAALCRTALTDPAGTSPQVLTKIEAELVVNAWLQAGTHAEAHHRLRDPVADPAQSALWRVNAAMAATLAGQPATESIGLLQPVLDSGELAAEQDSLTGTIATLVLIVNDHLDAALGRSETVIQAARPRGWLIALAHGSQLRAMALTRAGRARDAEADARLAVDSKLPATPPAAMLFALAFLIDALVELDELDAAQAVLAAASLGDLPVRALAAPLVLQSRARLRLAQRRPADAHADLLDAAARWRELGCCHPVLASWRVEATETLARLADPAGARRLAGEQLDLADRLGTPGARGTALRAMALAAPTDQRIPLLERSADFLSGSPARLEHARALVDLGAALRRANRRGEAREPLSRALDLAQRGGLRLIAQRAKQELIAAGARPRRDLLTGPGALTPAEYRVAALAAAGHTNQQIAEQLYITLRTVETHLTHTFQKLHVTGRGELADSMATAET